VLHLNHDKIGRLQVERPNKKREVVVYTWGNPANGRLGGVDPTRHYAPQENQKLTSLQAKKRIEVRRLLQANGWVALQRQLAGRVLEWSPHLEAIGW
jgi:hypothetical protein